VTKLGVRSMPVSGAPAELMQEAGIDAESITAAARELAGARVLPD
jgi:transketolase